MTRIIKNISKSNKEKLYNIAKTNKLEFNLLSTRYLQERLLYRLSISKYKNHFCLKGGVFLYYLEQFASRPTTDIDFLAINTSNDHDNIKKIFSEICSIKYSSDGVFFDSENIFIEEIKKEGQYLGVRVKIIGELDTIKLNLQVDIGFGDTVFPQPISIDYPVILKLGHPNILAYSTTSVIAEKFEAMISLSEFNSRMKDFYDVYNLLENQNIDINELTEAIKSTFQNRKTSYIEDHNLFNENFKTDKKRQVQWKAFLKKTNLNIDLQFFHVMTKIAEILKPIYDGLK